MIEAITPARFKWFDYSRYTFSLGLKANDVAFLSGHSASEYDRNEGRIVVRGGMREQTITAYEKIGAILEAADLRLNDIARVTEYIAAAGLVDLPLAQEVRDQTLPHEPPVSRVIVERLLREEALIEVEVATGAQDVFYISGLIPTRGGDLSAQTAEVFEKAGAALDELGLNFSQVVKTIDYITPQARADYGKTGRVRKDYLGPVYPAATGVIVPTLVNRDAMIQVDFIGSTQPLEAVNPGWERYKTLTYNPAVRAGNLLFMSGQASLDPQTQQAVHPGDIVAQTEYTYNNILKVLGAAGLGPQNLVKTIEFVTPAGLPRYRETAEVRAKILRAPFPASTGVVCHSLLRREFKIEVDPMAIYD